MHGPSPLCGTVLQKVCDKGLTVVNLYLIVKLGHTSLVGPQNNCWPLTALNASALPTEATTTIPSSINFIFFINKVLFSFKKLKFRLLKMLPTLFGGFRLSHFSLTYVSEFVLRAYS